MRDLGKTVENAFLILQKHNLVDTRLPVTRRNQQRAEEEASKMTITHRNVTGVRRSLTFPSVRAQHVQTIRSLSVSLDFPKDAPINARMFLENLAAVLRSLDGLQELTLTGSKQSLYSAPRDIFQGCSFSLRKLHCSVDKVLVASWSSLRQHSIHDFSGFLDVVRGPPSDVLPWGMANLKHLETSAYFAERLTNPANITHISLHTSRSRTRPTLWHLSNLLGDQLISLRVNRTLVESRSLSAEAVTEAAKEVDMTALLWESDSPLMICCMLRAPKLKYLEIRDKSLKVSRELIVG